jgi:glucose/arabinose dehydrogenase
MHLLLAILATCVLETSEHWGPDGQTSLRADTVVSGLEVPWSLAFLPNGDALVSERPGRVRLIHERKLVDAPVLKVQTGESSEGGLLGIAINPKDETQLFLYATVPGPKNQLERWKLARDHLSAGAYHDGGRLRFGPDGMLYLGIGDSTSPDRAQDLESKNGKILRLAPDGSIPRDNPFPGSPVFLYGVRNPEAFDWLDDGRIIIADHGPSGDLGRYAHDRVLIAQKGDNLGWPKVYGCDALPKMNAPLISWETKALPPGGAVIYRGKAIPQFRGSLLAATLGSEHLHRVVFDEKAGVLMSHEVYFRQTYGRLREIAMTPSGELWMTTSNCDGRGECGPEKDRILRVVPR